MVSENCYIVLHGIRINLINCQRQSTNIVVGFTHLQETMAGIDETELFQKDRFEKRLSLNGSGNLAAQWKTFKFQLSVPFKLLKDTATFTEEKSIANMLLLTGP